MIGVIGCGNMASAIVKGISQRFGDEKFVTYTPTFTRAQILAEAVKGTAVKELSGLNSCDVLIIGCKPQQFQDLSTKLKSQVDLKNKYIISIMAAVPTETIVKTLGAKMVTRIMPNTPALYGEGVSLMYHSADVTPAWQEKCRDYFSACSNVHLLKDETSFDQATTVTGSGPAYVYYFAKTFVDQLLNWGIEESEARKMVTQLFKGSARLMEENAERPLSVLIDEVTSKGGVTIEAIKVFQNKKLNEISEEALGAAFHRSQELKSQFEDKA